jgi:hypothetical protein
MEYIANYNREQAAVGVIMLPAVRASISNVSPTSAIMANHSSFMQATKTATKLPLGLARDLFGKTAQGDIMLERGQRSSLGFDELDIVSRFPLICKRCSGKCKSND